jgi:hypothetical protein
LWVKSFTSKAPGDDDAEVETNTNPPTPPAIRTSVLFVDVDLAVDVALVLDRATTTPGTYERLGLLIARRRLPEDKVVPEARKQFIQTKRRVFTIV